MPPFSKYLNVPAYSEEALTWCGPATGQMIMEGYPSGKCQILQEDVNAAILSNKTETMWDTDPVGLKNAMSKLCPLPPGHGWSIFDSIDPTKLMYYAAYYIATNSYPVAALLNTFPHHSSIPSHSEHWVSITGIVTDVTPVGNPSVSLQFVRFNDPVTPNLGNTVWPRTVSAAYWYTYLLKPVTKAGSSYIGKYIAVIEPPVATGTAKAPAERLIGRVIPPREALRFAARWISEYKLNEIQPYQTLSESEPLEPLLVNKDRGGYYIIPYIQRKPEKTAQPTIFINAYTGAFQEIGIVKPTEYVAEEEAIRIGLQQLGKARPRSVTAELVFPPDEATYARYFPIWKVVADKETIGIEQKKTVRINMR